VPKLIWGGCDHMVVGLSTTYAISDITTNVVSSNIAQARSLIKFVGDLRQVGFLHQ